MISFLSGRWLPTGCHVYTCSSQGVPVKVLRKVHDVVVECV